MSGCEEGEDTVLMTRVGINQFFRKKNKQNSFLRENQGKTNHSFLS